MKKVILCVVVIFVGVFLFMVGSVYFNTFMKNEESESLSVAVEPPQDISVSDPFFDEKVQSILSEKILLLEQLAVNPVLVSEAKISSEVHRTWNENAFLELDRQLRTENSSGVEKMYLSSDTALELLDFQEKNDGFSEIFVTDAYGMNVGQTNRTTDYYQADEAWWQKTYKNGQGQAYYDPIEYDASAQIEGVPLYVPVKNTEDGAVVGVIKAIFHVAALKIEL